MKTYMPQIRFSSPTQRLAVILFSILLLLILVISTGANQSKEPSFIEKLGADYVIDARNHALTIGIIRNGKQEVFTFGENQKGSGEKINANAIYELGNVSEVFTTSLLALLESEGKISSLDAVAHVLKGKVKVPHYQRIICVPPKVTEPEDKTASKGNVCYPDPQDAPQMMVLCDLATHSSGLPIEPPYSIFNNKNPYAFYTIDKLNDYVGRLSPTQAFGFQYNHSMIGMGLLGEALSVKTGKAYETLLKEKILTPLSMTSTFITPTPEQTALFLDGHNAKGKPTNHRDYSALTPAAGIRSNVPDLLKFVDANLKTTTHFNIALSETHIPRIFTDPADWKAMVGWGWISSIGIPSEKPLNSIKDKRIFWKSDEQGGFAAYVGFIKDSNIGVVILSNSANRVDDMGMAILKYLESTPATVSVH
jgi:serine-type D-Ala-D-Ala carboxypeptidase/endopeptidase